jgi:hypothetical protein
MDVWYSQEHERIQILKQPYLMFYATISYKLLFIFSDAGDQTQDLKHAS